MPVTEDLARFVLARMRPRNLLNRRLPGTFQRVAVLAAVSESIAEALGEASRWVIRGIRRFNIFFGCIRRRELILRVVRQRAKRLPSRLWWLQRHRSAKPFEDEDDDEDEYDWRFLRRRPSWLLAPAFSSARRREEALPSGPRCGHRVLREYRERDWRGFSWCR